jgi:RNA polymerase sigma factor (TIGR02999 family)
MDEKRETSDRDEQSLDAMLPLVYEHLRRIAHRQRANAQHDTLNTTGLVHEAYLKLSDRGADAWTDRAHFFALASVAMRHVLVDHAKARLSQKRGGERHRVTLDTGVISAEEQPETLLDINDALDRLSVVEPRLARVVECRFFGGLSEEETAAALEVTTRTVQRDWVKARMLLRRALSA